MAATIIIGYGNPDRQDDGAAWHILAGLARRFGREIPTWPEDVFNPSGENPDLLFNLQLMPELAETISQYERVCFVDAHTGGVLNDLNIQLLHPLFQNSPFTHHMTPETCLTLAESVYHARPESLLVSVRGYQFGFSHDLSEKTQALVTEAIHAILKWVG
ncbi:MAG: hypothetical protein IT308_08675 [Anaerolineaceae bacterium]|nr:hypothetical protein [Anaerolineaceae bacterium]